MINKVGCNLKSTNNTVCMGQNNKFEGSVKQSSASDEVALSINSMKAKNIAFGSKSTIVEKALNLSDLAIGQVVKVVGFSDEQVQRKMIRLGIIRNDVIAMYAKTPFGGPIAVKKNNTVIAIGKNMADSINIEKISLMSGKNKMTYFQWITKFFHRSYPAGKVNHNA